MKPFVKKNNIEPKGIEKLLKKIPDENFLVDVNNLLAEKLLDEITVGQIQYLAEKYRLKDPSHRFKNELLQMLKDYLSQHLNVWGDKDNDSNSAKKLQNILGISDKDFEKEYKLQTTEIFKKKVNETLNKSKKFQEEEVSQFEQLRQQLELPQAEAELVHTEIRNSIVRNYITSMISDFRVSPEEIKTYEKLCKDLAVSVSMDDESRKTLEKYKRLWTIDNGDLPVITTDIILQKGELCHYKANVQLYEDRKVTTGVKYGGATHSIRIAKGWYYRTGNINTARKTEDVMTLIDSGGFYVTNKRILFNGDKGNKPIRYNQIVDLTPFSDGVKIVKETGKPHTFIMDHLDGESLTATIARIIRDNQK